MTETISNVKDIMCYLASAHVTLVDFVIELKKELAGLGNPVHPEFFFALEINIESIE